jgi:hypothetical protein
MCFEIALYEISTTSEETYCDNCGMSLFIGDMACDYEDGSTIVCSLACLKRLLTSEGQNMDKPDKDNHISNKFLLTID